MDMRRVTCIVRRLRALHGRTAHAILRCWVYTVYVWLSTAMGMEDEQYHIWLLHAQFLRTCLMPHMTGENGSLDTRSLLAHDRSLYFCYEFCCLHIYPVYFHQSMHKNSTCTLIRHATFFKITSTKYPNFTVKPLYLLWWCRGEDNLGIGLLASKKAVQDIRRSLVLAQYFLSYGVSKSSGQTTSKSPWGPTYRRNKRRKDPKYFRILSSAS